MADRLVVYASLKIDFVDSYKRRPVPLLVSSPRPGRVLKSFSCVRIGPELHEAKKEMRNGVRCPAIRPKPNVGSCIPDWLDRNLRRSAQRLP